MNSQGKDDKNHTRLYRASKIHSHPTISLTTGGLILIGLLSGGDYAQAGLPGCGITTAHALARCGFGDTLHDAATTLPRDALPAFLISWRQGLREELRTNSQGIIGRKLGKLAKEVPNSFPDIDILLSYTNPITSESLGRAVEKNLKLTWGKEPDVGKLAALCEFYFEWGYKESIIKRFRTLLWHSIVLRILRRAVINAEASDPGPSSTVVPSTPRKHKDHTQPRIINTPSKMVAKHFASMALDTPTSREKGDSQSDDEEPLIIKIHSARNHASTDGLLEYRLEIAPAQLVRLAELGIKGTREPPEKDEWASEEDAADDNDDSDVGKKAKGPKPPLDPASHLRLWMPACMVEMAEPEIVEEFKERKSKKAAKKNGKTGGGSRATKQTKKKSSKSSEPLYDSDTDQRQTIDDMLRRRPTTIPSTPSRSADVRKKKVRPIREESEESESDALLTMPIFVRKAASQSRSRAESSKAAAEREKHRKSGLGYLSVSDEDEASEQVHPFGATTSEKPAMRNIPAPFPISFDTDDDVFSSSDIHGRLTIPRPAKTSFRTPSQTSDSERHESPRKSVKRTPLERHTRSGSPSRVGTSRGAVAISTTIIEISSDDSDDSDTGPSAASVQRPVVPPLILAKARRNKQQSTTVGPKAKIKRTSGDRDLTVIDLT